MAGITKAQRRRNEQLEQALTNLNGSDEERHNLARRFFSGDYTPWPAVVHDWSVFYTPLDVALEPRASPESQDFSRCDIVANDLQGSVFF